MLSTVRCPSCQRKLGIKRKQGDKPGSQVVVSCPCGERLRTRLPTAESETRDILGKIIPKGYNLDDILRGRF